MSGPVRLLDGHQGGHHRVVNKHGTWGFLSAADMEDMSLCPQSSVEQSERNNRHCHPNPPAPYADTGDRKRKRVFILSHVYLF